MEIDKHSEETETEHEEQPEKDDLQLAMQKFVKDEQESLEESDDTDYGLTDLNA